MEYIPLYTKSDHYARTHGELNELIACYNASISCKDKIEDVLKKYVQKKCFDPDEEIKALVQEFGYERFSFIFALNLMYNLRGLHPEVREWAEATIDFDVYYTHEYGIRKDFPDFVEFATYFVRSRRRVLSESGLL